MIRRFRIAALAASLGVVGGLAALSFPAHAATTPPLPVSPATQLDTNGSPICVAVTWLNWGDCITIFQQG